MVEGDVAGATWVQAGVVVTFDSQEGVSFAKKSDAPKSADELDK